MLNSALRWIIPLGALLILGPLAGLLTASLHAPDGGQQTTLLLNDAPVLGIIAAILAVVLATIAGSVSARLHGSGAGLLSAGLVLAWAAWGTGNIDQILRRTQSGSVFWTIAVEGAIVGVLGCLAAAVILAFANDGARDPSAQRSGPLTRLTRQFLRTPSDHDEQPAFVPLLTALALAVAGAAVGAWLLAQESLKGQTFAAAIVAGILAAGLGHAGDQRARATLFFAAIGLLAVAAPLAAAIIYSNSADAVRAAYASTLLPPARILPLDWLAGAFVGIPIGLNWAGSMLEKHPVPE